MNTIKYISKVIILKCSNDVGPHCPNPKYCTYLRRIHTILYIIILIAMQYVYVFNNMFDGDSRGSYLYIIYYI